MKLIFSSFQLFIYLFAPLFNHLKDIDFKTNLRLENGLKIWSAMYECRHPEASCFTAHCRAKPRVYWNRFFKSAKHHMLSDDVFVGGSKSTLITHKLYIFSNIRKSLYYIKISIIYLMNLSLTEFSFTLFYNLFLSLNVVQISKVHPTNRFRIKAPHRLRK